MDQQQRSNHTHQFTRPTTTAVPTETVEGITVIPRAERESDPSLEQIAKELKRLGDRMTALEMNMQVISQFTRVEIKDDLRWIIDLVRQYAGGGDK